MQVAEQLTNEVLTPRSQQAKVLGVNKVIYISINTAITTANIRSHFAVLHAYGR